MAKTTTHTLVSSRTHFLGRLQERYGLTMTDAEYARAAQDADLCPSLESYEDSSRPQRIIVIRIHETDVLAVYDVDGGWLKTALPPTTVSSHG